jgi:hypothetical protein
VTIGRKSSINLAAAAELLQLAHIGGELQHFCIRRIHHIVDFVARFNARPGVLVQPVPNPRSTTACAYSFRPAMMLER